MPLNSDYDSVEDAELNPYSRYSIGELELSGWQKMAGMTGSRQALEVNVA